MSAVLPVLGVLASPRRQEILRLVWDGEQCAGDIHAAMPDVTFGAMLANSVSYFERVPTLLFIPGTILVILVVSFNLFGDAVRDALDPKVVR